jgi:hypothetical protein
VPTLHKPATTITDYLLTLECAWFVWVLVGRSTPGFVRSGFIALFASVAAAAFFGGTMHGFFPVTASTANRALWTATLLSFGITAAAMFSVGTRLRFGAETTRKLTPVLAVGVAAYSGVVLFVSQDLLVAMVAYLAAAFFLMAVLLQDWRRRPSAGAVAGILGIMLTLLAALAQQSGVALHPVYFDHNVIYHVIQAVALYLFFRSALEVGEPH